MKEKHINLIKMCVGAHTVSDLYDWQSTRLVKGINSNGPFARHVTRMHPKRAEEILNGGSLYWVFKGFTLARQQILGLEETVGTDSIMRCSIMLSRQIVLTEPYRKRPFQGWRYLKINEAPRDLGLFSEGDIQLPASLERGLHEIGIF